MAATLCFGLSGCQEAAFKWGGDAGGLQQARQACAPRRANPDDYAACMKDKGWTIAQMDSDAPTTAESTPPTSAAASPPPASMGGEMPGMAMGMSMPPAATASKPAPAPAAHVRSPTDLVTVSSWWKPGGNAGGFNDAVAACVMTLGEAHKPDTAHHQVTRAMVSCLKDKGWYGV